jgi:hypothetical protein
LDVYESSEPKPVLLPANLRGKVFQVDPKWNFVVLDIGLNEDALEGGELLVSREGKLVGKVQIRSVQKDRCVANLLPGWQIGEIMEGDLVIPAHPDPTHVIRITSTRSSL